LLLEDVDYTYDVSDNPTVIRDFRNPAEWPPGAQPVTRKMQYDDLSRVTRVDYQYASGDDTWVDPFAAEDVGDSSQQDPRRAKPSPHLSFDKRVRSQSIQYDWLGNTVSTDDDAKGFYERSLGTITNGGADGKPYQLKSASGGAAPRDGSLTTAYDDAGNLVGLSVVRNASAPCLPTNASCSQRYAYEWDEVGRLTRATRWDGAGLGAVSDPTPSLDTAAAALTYVYDRSDNRVLKTARDGQGNEVHTAYVFDSLELRRAHFDGTDFEQSVWTEVPYLSAHGVRLARVHYATNDVPTATSGAVHVLLELADHLGSNAIVLDAATSELVESSSYLAYGGAESDYRPARWDSYREDYRFTGKEDDAEVGLTYFGARYYAPALDRWSSPDPLALHGLGADPNLYSYVSGRTFGSIDSDGLEPRPVAYRPMPVFAPPPPEPPKWRTSRYQELGVEVPPDSPGDPQKLPPLQVRIIRGPGEPTALPQASGKGIPEGYVSGFIVAPYKTLPPRRANFGNLSCTDRPAVEGHHGILSEAASRMVPNYREGEAPAMLIPTDSHDATRAAYNEWAKQLDPKFKTFNEDTKKLDVNWDKLVGENVDEVYRLRDKMFDSFKAPQALRDEYNRQFEVYKENQEFKQQYQEYILQKSQWEMKYGPQIQPLPADTGEP
jgi:RHS repeat-associated protein